MNYSMLYLIFYDTQLNGVLIFMLCWMLLKNFQTCHVLCLRRTSKKLNQLPAFSRCPGNWRRRTLRVRVTILTCRDYTGTSWWRWFFIIWIWNISIFKVLSLCIWLQKSCVDQNKKQEVFKVNKNLLRKLLHSCENTNFKN